LPSVLGFTGITLWGPVIAYMAMIFGLSSLSKPPQPPGVSFYAVHVIVYMGLGALTARAAGTGLTNVNWRAVVIATLISSLYGVSDEYHQLFVPGRSFDVFDIVADAIGSLVGASAVGAWSIIRRRS
jgi:VanZ family protein